MRKASFQKNRRRARKTLLRGLQDRRVVGGLLILLQLFGMIALLVFAAGRNVWIYEGCILVSFVMVVWLVRKEDNPAYKIPWIILILLFPLVGGMAYLIWGNTPFNSAKSRHKYEPEPPDFSGFPIDAQSDALEGQFPQWATLSRYLLRVAQMPPWRDEGSAYYPCGEAAFAPMCEDVRRARRFVWLEYFIIEDGVMWDTLRDILTEKAAHGVDVRVIYDDAGCIATLPHSYRRYLEELGFRVVCFNRFIPTTNTYLNHRDHRKMLIVDGAVGYMGGINLADEYINRVERFGYWKDTVVRLCGQAVGNMTALFDQLWQYSTQEAPTALHDRIPQESGGGDGFVQPFADSPLDNNNVGEDVYMQIIHRARRYVYITTPYLVLDNEMLTALILAAKSGVDVRIMTPGIPDKKLVYLVTRSFYGQLHRAGVRIYEYTPGFLHAKMIVADDEVGVIGTMNMDFRSFYMHFECGTVFYGGKTILRAREDMEVIQQASREIDAEWLRRTPWPVSIAASLLRLLAPLL
jgi:cardiolipin synthase